jgi:hypothetical protein
MPPLFLSSEAAQIVPKKRRRISRFHRLPFDIQVEPRFNRTRLVKRLNSDSEIFRMRMSQGDSHAECDLAEFGR